MNMRLALIGLMLALFPAIALAGENPVLGTWKLKSFVREVTATGERIINSVNIQAAISATRQTAACTRFLHRRIASGRATRIQQMRNGSNCTGP